MTLSALYRSSFKIIFLLLIVPTGLLAQGTIPNYTALVDIIPPSPNSASLGKYAGINVGLVSGMANISVPLNEFTSNNLHVPLSVNYSSNGLKVDEIASRVGLGWTFNAGGAITRTVSGLPDEQVPRLLPPSDFPTPDQNFINFADELNNTAANDGQPDLFSFNFNGYSGQFMLDNNLNPVLLTYSSLKIEKNFIGTDWNFKVTTPDGVQYFFGGSDATETSNKSQMNCGRIFPNFAATAWYVNKIVHPNQDTVVFNYTINGAYDYFTGVSQTAYSGLIAFGVNLGSTYAPPNPPNTTCISSLTTISPLLTSITSSAGGTIKFFYINRPDIGDKLLNRIEYYQPNQSAFYKFYNLSYQTVRSPNYNSNVLPSDTTLYYRPFLTEIDEGNPVNSQQKTHVFTYNNLNQLPARLSFAQDDYGYFNGANNGSLIPVPPSYIPASDFTSANANRTPNPIYSVNGTLAKIQYPTGGSDSLVYEANTYYAEIQALNNQIVNLEGAGIGQLTPNTIVSANFHLTNSSVNVLAALSGSCTYNSNSGYTYDPVHNTAEFSIIDSASNTAVFDQSYATGQTISLPNAATLLLGHTYYLKATPRGAGVVVGFNLSYVDGTLPPVFVNAPTGGLRVNKIITKANVNDTSPQIKDYYYYNSLNPSQSTGSAIFAPRYDNYVTLYVNSTYGGGPSAGEDTYTYYMMTSNSLINLYPYPAPVYYSSVIESYGDNFANGGTEHHFQLMPDKPGNSISGNYIPSAPLNSYSWENGLELYSCTFKMSGNIQIPLKKIYTHYNIDSRVNQQFTGYLVNKKYSTSFQYTPPSADQLNAYDLESYSHFQRWVYPDTVTTQTYDQSGQNYVTEVNVSTYGNLSHAMLTKNASSTSDGRREITRYIYPQDTTLTGDEETGRQALISNYMLGTKLISIQTLNSTLVSADKVSYHVFPNGLVLPQTYNVQIGTNTAENRVTFTGYNNNGKLLSQSLINGPVVSYQWGYNSLYPVAQASNAAANDIFYDSFEEGDGNNSAIAKTGHYSYSGAYAHTLSGLDNGSYTLSYWQNNGSGWVLVTNPETVSGGSYTITLSGQIDDVRFYPAAAQMTTYTYDPLVGMTSSTDAKNEVTYYEYDPFQRLMNVKDKDGNIVKHMFYHYQGQ